MKGLPGFVRSYPAVVVALLTLAAVLVMLAADAESAARWTASIVVIAFALWTAIDMVRQLLRGHMGLDILALVAMVSALAVGEYLAALIVVLMLSGGEALEDYAAQRSKRDLDALLRHSPQVAHIDDGGTLRDVGVDEVAAGDVLIVRPSEVIPVDAELLSETGEFDTSSLTGESLPVSYSTGDEVLSGMVNGTAAVRVRALRGSADSQFQQIVRLVEEAESAKAPMVRLADRFALPFTVVSLAIAGIAWAVSGDPVRFAEVLVLATPCPLLIAAPVAFMGGLSRASRAGMVVKGGAVLEALSRVESAVFDKTGTLTAGTPALADVRPAAGFEADELLSLAASAEQYSSHVLAVSIVAEARTRGLSVVEAQRAEEQATNGVVAVIEGREVVVGKPAYVDELVGGVEREPLADGEAAAYVAVDGEYAGALILADEVRPESAETVAWLRAHGVERQAMLTGDAEPTAKAIAARVGIDEVHAELLPADKVRLAGEMQPRPVLMVGDGVNDAPVLAAADIGIAMGAKGSTAAGEAADAVILRDRIDVVADSVHIARHTVRVATTAIWIGIALSLGLMLIATTGAIPAVAGALTQEFVDLAAILYALRALRPPERS